jgi:integrase
MAQIRRFASALVAAGVPIEELHSLADLLPLARIEVGVQWIADNRHGGGTSQGLRETMLGLSMLGREIGLDAAHLNAIRGYANALAVDKTGQRTRRKGLTEKNRERLRRLRDPETQLSLLRLPRNLLEKAAHERHPVKAARLAEVALAIAILTIAPIRLKNLASLEITRHFDRTSGARIYLVIPEVEVKNGKPLEFELSERVSAMLDAFLKRWHPGLTTRNCPWLFARCDGASHVHQTVLARRITETIRRELGLDVNTHLFRRFTAMFILERDPGAYDRVRLLLGHAAQSETVTAYTGLESIDASRFLANAVEEELQKQSKRTRSRRRR